MKGQRKKMAGHKIRTKDLDPLYEFDGVPADLADHEIRALDPGNHTPFTYGTKDEDGNWKHGGISKKEYAHKTKRGKVTKKEARDRKRHRIDQVIERLSQLTLKTSSWRLLLAAVVTAAECLDSLHTFYSRKPWLKLKFEAKQAEQRAFYHVIDNVFRGKNNKKNMKKKKKKKRKKWTKTTKPKPECTNQPGAKLVVIGDGGRMSGIKGTTSSAPVAKIKRLAVKLARRQGWHFRTIDEAYTSKNSNCCPGFTMETILTGHKTRITKDGRIVRCTVHGISRCTNCVTLWNRDCSATRNMHAITKAKLSNQNRPWWLNKGACVRGIKPSKQSVTEGSSDCAVGWAPRIQRGLLQSMGPFLGRFRGWLGV
jgi:hypothetical protein